ncbi:negative transcriptional regulator [Sarocladium strictum]
MYIRAVHAGSSLKVLRQLIRDHPLGLLTTAIQSKEFPFLQSSHIPFILDVDDETSETETGRLRGHLARQNPHSKAMIESLTSQPDREGVLEHDVVVIFTAQHHYVTPKFYTETKPSTGKVVPTWNYAAAQIYGRAKIYYDSRSDDTSQFLQKQITDLTKHAETHIMGYVGGERPKDWKVTDAPERYIEILRKNIIGIEIEVERLEGKFKMSQEMGKGDREGVASGFDELGTDVAQEISSIVKQRSEEKDG